MQNCVDYLLKQSSLEEKIEASANEGNNNASSGYKNIEGDDKSPNNLSKFEKDS